MDQRKNPTRITTLASDKNNIFSCFVESIPVKLETICTVILTPMVSVLWIGP